MKLIKLSAIDSTNDFLKVLSRNEGLDNFTTVVAENQTNGKGQMGSVWDSENGKNVIMSTLIKDVLTESNAIFYLNVAISLSVLDVLESLGIPKLSVKWPNDIMSDNKKIAGILIENSFKIDNKIESVVGIGLNVNQKNFILLPKATSLSVVMNKEFDLDEIVNSIVFTITKKCKIIVSNQSELLWEEYHQKLFKIGVPIAFEDANQKQFMGIIQKVTYDGKLQVIVEDDSIKTFLIKEITMLY